MVTVSNADIRESVTGLRPLIEENAAASEQARRVVSPVIEALNSTGVFHTFVPTGLGGSEIDLPSALRLFEDVCSVDGSTGWVTMICATSGIAAAYLPEPGARTVFGEGPGVVTGGIVAPRGTAVTVSDGFRVSGRWPFGSGCLHSSWMALNCFVETNGELEKLPNGQRDLRFVLFPASEVEIIDTWHVTGLRATGSNDIAVKDVFVPRERTYSFILDPPLHPGTLYKFSVIGLFASVVAACALGIARGALDEIRAMAPNRTPVSLTMPLWQWGHAQSEYALGEASLRAGRALLFEAVQDVWDALERGDTPTVEQQAMVRLAATYAVNGSVRAVDAAYALGGGAAIYEGSTLQRRFRDVHTITQHFLVAPATMELSGRALFGLELEPGFL